MRALGWVGLGLGGPPLCSPIRAAEIGARRAATRGGGSKPRMALSQSSSSRLDRSRLDLGGDGRRYMMAPRESVARLRETLHEMELVIGGRRAAQRDGATVLAARSRLDLGSISAGSRLDLG